MGYGGCDACSCKGYVDKNLGRCATCGHHFNAHKNTGRGGGCFVTTAALAAIGKNDDCEELEVFRNYRDQWLLHQPEGEHIVMEYYKVAPQIVEAINCLPNRDDIYAALWHQSIQECLILIQQGENESAKLLYHKTINDLREKYIG